MMMFMLEDIALWAVLVAAAINLIIGFVWYSPAVFGEKWMKLMKIKPEKDMNMPLYMAGGYLTSLGHAYGLALILEHFNALDFVPAIKAAVIMCILFNVAGMFGGVLWEKKPLKVFYINAGCVLASFIGMAAFYAYIA